MSKVLVMYYRTAFQKKFPTEVANNMQTTCNQCRFMGNYRSPFGMVHVLYTSRYLLKLTLSATVFIIEIKAEFMCNSDSLDTLALQCI